MRRLFQLLFISTILLLYSCANISSSDKTANLPTIAIAGLGIESSTFSPARTEREAFHPKTGDEIFERYPFLAEDSLTRKRAHYVPTLVGKSLPGGMVTREAYESLVTETLELLEANKPYDGLFLDIHGAMSVEGLDDPEGDYIERIRKVIGAETIISTSMDLHGNVSQRLAHHSDLITCYRMAPHEDAIESKKRTLTNLLDRLEQGKGKPQFKAWVRVPILLPGEKTSTRVEPGKTLYAGVPDIADQDGVTDAAIWMGYPWADEPRNHGVVMVVGDDKEKVEAGAQKLAEDFWRVRKDFEFVCPVGTLEESLEQALSSTEKPFIISDSGDNPTAGGAGDVTWTLARILEKEEFKNPEGPSLIYASIPGPLFVEEAIEIGVGGEIDAEAGARVDDRYEGPVRLKGKIMAINHGDVHAETEVVVKVGSVLVIVTKKRKPYHHISDFTNLGLDPVNTDIVVVKIGYLVPELYDIRKGWIMALTPGGVDQDLVRLDFKRIQRPMIPFDMEMADPELEVVFIPVSEE